MSGKTQRSSASSGLQTNGVPHHVTVERCIGLCHPIQRKAPGAVLRGGCQPSSHFGIGDQSVDGGAERRRIFGVDEEGRVTPILTQRADVAEHQRASGCGRFEDREAKGLVPSRRCKNLRAAKTARQFRCRQKAEQFDIGEARHAAIGVFDISGYFDRPGKPRRGRIQNGEVFCGVPQSARGQHDRPLIECSEGGGLDPVRDHCGAARQRHVMALEILENGGGRHDDAGGRGEPADYPAAICGPVQRHARQEDDVRPDPELEALSAPERRLAVQTAVHDALSDARAILPVGSLAEVVNEVSDEVVGLGPIERLLKDPEVSEVMVNGADDVYVERKGRIEKVEGLWFEGLR